MLPLMFAGNSGIASGYLLDLMAYWAFDEASDGSLPSTRYDQVSTNHLIDLNTVASPAGKLGLCASFAAANSESLRIDDNAALSTGDIDFEFNGWAQVADRTLTNLLLAKLNNSGVGEYQLYAKATGDLTFEVWRSGSIVGTVTYANFFAAANTWYNFSVYHDSVNNVVGICKNGGAATTGATSNAPADTALAFSVGSRSNGGYSTCKLDELGFWKRLLTADERTALYNGGTGLTYPFDGATAPEILLQAPEPYQVFQRDGSNQATIAIRGNVVYGSGTYDVEASWGSGGYTQIAAGISSTFSGSLTGQSAGQGTLDVRIKTAGTSTVITSTSVQNVGIGDVFIIAGQSNAEGKGTTNNVYTHATLKAGLYGNDYRWRELADPVDSLVNQVDSVSAGTGGIGSPWPLLATSIMATTGFPVAFVPCPMGGSTIADWQPGASHVNRATLYGSMNYRASLTGCKAVLFHQGEQDVGLGTSQATYNAALDALANAINSDRGVVLLAAKIHNISGDESKVNAAIAEAVGDNANVKLGADNTGLNTSPDGTHFTTDAEVSGLASRWWTAIQAAFGW